ncbi:MAG: GNAT family N-acetyltransferase [Verrucomicrobiales bacterium]
METISVRPLSSQDLPAAATLLRSLNPNTPAETIHRRLSTILSDHPHYQLHGAFVDDRLAGVCSAWIATKIWCGKYLEIDNIVVDPDQRSSGIGTHLIERMEQLARENECLVITLDSYTANHPSHRLYHRLGFEIWGYHFIKPIGNWSGAPNP